MPRFARDGLVGAVPTRRGSSVVRMLFKNRTFSCMALATMTLAIGSTTAVFQRGGRRADAAATVRRARPPVSRRRREPAGPLRRAALEQRAGRLRGAPRRAGFQHARRDWPERVKGSQVSANFFRVLGVRPILGHDFADGSDRPGAPRTAILSHAFWTQQYGARRDVIGPTIGARRCAVRDRWRDAGRLRVPVAGGQLLDSDATRSAKRRRLLGIERVLDVCPPARRSHTAGRDLRTARLDSARPRHVSLADAGHMGCRHYVRADARPYGGRRHGSGACCCWARSRSCC